MIDTIDINGDGKLNIVAHYWCNQWNKLVTFTDPTPNSLVVYLSQPDGSYKIANEEVFGTRIVDLGGASRKSRVADFNNDGYMDIFYAMNHEDGRPVSIDNTNQYSKAAFIMSIGKGRYNVDLLNPSNWYHGIDIAANDSGGFDAVANGVGNGKAIAFRNTRNTWQLIDGYPQVSGGTFSFVNPAMGMTTQLVSGGLQSAAQLQLFRKSNDNIWAETSNIFYETKLVPYTSWQGSETDVQTISIGGNDIVAAGFDETCIINIEKNGNPFVVARMSGYLISGGYKNAMGRIKEGSTPAYQSLLSYEIVEDKLIERNDLIIGEDTTVTFNKYQCRDINGDGYMDIVGYPDSVGLPDPKKGSPVIYINNTKGKLVSFSSAAFPVAPDCYGYTRTRMADLNKDGIDDLIVFRQEPASGTCSTAPIMIYYGNEKIKLPS
jgi:hypothetical protein